ncbi:hypothetical protein CANARDRAFT_30634 [[Candida] arabinofermentans NRRL YB-2248]|uniref:Uncharacterized protein n=1 Tax=[Candida] arabinofermentans NRRL YB-2248 TaxID=983967 RepID=A0A1E4ST92_9ASCO|nr:hypothetical protein CANARDRAFT_30634 [[Candida] arabinofermentans NRRL YB-2248]
MKSFATGSSKHTSDLAVWSSLVRDWGGRYPDRFPDKYGGYVKGNELEIIESFKAMSDTMEGVELTLKLNHEVVVNNAENNMGSNVGNTG